jgi:hypothetical protein
VFIPKVPQSDRSRQVSPVLGKLRAGSTGRQGLTPIVDIERLVTGWLFCVENGFAFLVAKPVTYYPFALVSFWKGFRYANHKGIGVWDTDGIFGARRSPGSSHR